MSGISTKDNAVLTKKDKIAQLKLKHDPIFEKIGEANPLFIPKMVFGTPKVMYLFPSELKSERDIYTELVSKEYDSEDPTRTLYKWTFNPNYANTYEKKQFGHSPDSMYIIPFTELVPVVFDEETDEFDLPDPDLDPPLSELTIRDLAAIMLKKPVSLKPWLNQIIKS